MTNKKPRYTGVLRRRLPNPVAEPLEWLLAWQERMSALADHYGLDRSAPDFHFWLAQKLAADHVEGFKANLGEGGRPFSPEQVARDIVLFSEVLKAREEGRTNESAYDIIIERDCARGIETKKATLRRRLGVLIKQTPASARMLIVIARLTASSDKKSS
jgi:hypothetical protein